MKKFLPYKSLNEQSDFINQMLYEKNKIDKPIISSDIKEKINYILSNYNNDELDIRFYNDGYVYNMTSKVYKIDILYKKLYFSKYEYLDFNNILDINLKNNNDFY